MRLAAHVHTDFSDDCDWPLDRIVRTLRRTGFDGALVCDHDRSMSTATWARLVEACKGATTPRFLVVPGVEYQDPTHTFHFPVYGDIPFFGRSPDIGELLEFSRAAGGVSVLAHPTRRNAFMSVDERWLELVNGIEVWNRKYDGIQPNRWAIEIARNHGLTQFTALDFHGPRQLFPIHMAVTGGRNEQTALVSVVAALRNGAAHASFAGIQVDHTDAGPVGRTLGSLESLRSTLAPAIRRLERRLRGR